MHRAQVEYKLLKFGEHTFKVGWPDTPLYIVPSEPGDLVIWNLRTLHSAGARRLAAKPELAMLPNFEDEIFHKVPGAFLPPPGPRNAIFFDYGTATEEVDLYIKHRSLRVTSERLAQTKDWSYDSEDVHTAFNGENIGLRFDPIIACLCVRLDELRKQNAPESETRELAGRLYALLKQHEEFSPHFSLFSVDRFKKCAARSRDEAVHYAVKAVVERIETVAKD